MVKEPVKAHGKYQIINIHIKAVTTSVNIRFIDYFTVTQMICNNLSGQLSLLPLPLQSGGEYIAIGLVGLICPWLRLSTYITKQNYTSFLSVSSSKARASRDLFFCACVSGHS